MVFAGPVAAAAEGEQGDGLGCPVVATAQGVQVMASKSDDLFLAAPSGAAVPAAQACVNHELGESRAFASNPYPGGTVVSVPGLLARSTGLPVPGYPAHVSTRFPPEDESEVSEEGYSLRAQSAKTSSDAEARSGVSDKEAAAGALMASAAATISPDDGSSQARATAQSDPVVINNVLALGQVRSLAMARVDADGALSRRSRLQVGRTMVAGQVVEITPEGVRVAEETTGLEPTKLPETEPVEVLEEAGIQVRYLGAVETTHGVLAAGIEVTARQQVDQGIITVQYTFGRAFAAAQPVSGAAGGLDGDSGLADITGADGFAPVGDDQALSGGAAPSASQEIEQGSLPEPVSGPSGAAAPTAPPEPEVAPPDVSAGSEQVMASPARAPVDMGMAGVYLVVVAGGLTMVVTGTLLRLLGVKT